MSLFYSKESKKKLFGYADVGYLSDPHKANHKQGTCLIVMILLFLGDTLRRQWWSHHRIIKRLWQFTKQVMNLYGYDR